MFCKYQRLYKA